MGEKILVTVDYCEQKPEHLVPACQTKQEENYTGWHSESSYRPVKLK